jgi:hypothetical protein
MWASQGETTYAIVEVLSISGGLDDTSADTPITETLGGLAVSVALERVALEKTLHDLEDLILLDRGAVTLVQALTVVATTQVHVVSAKGLSNEGDLRKPGASTTVGATGHTHDNAVTRKTTLLKGRFELGDEDGEVTLGLCHGETAGRESNTSRRRQT